MDDHQELIHADITHAVIGAFFAVHTTLGYGFVENVYARALEVELRSRRVEVQREVLVAVRYRGQEIAYQRLDMLAAGKVVLEIKTGPAIRTGATHQLHNYLRATGLQVGLVLHFGPRAQFKRLVCTRSRFELASIEEGFGR
jgi:GxxExxY protein